MPPLPDTASVAPDKPAGTSEVSSSEGLTSDEAHRRLAAFGPNATPDVEAQPLRMVLTKFWAPVPWMLEAAIVLEVALGKYVEAAIIAGLLVLTLLLVISRRAVPRQRLPR